MNISIVESMRTASNFRIFLRNYFYPMNQQLIQNSLYTHIQDLYDMDYSADILEYKLKCKKKKSVDIEKYDFQLESALIDILNSGNIIENIQTSTLLDENTKYNFDMICHNIMSFMHMSSYLKSLYGILYYPINTTTRLVIVGL